MQLEFLNVLPFMFSFDKFLPCRQQIFNWNDIIVSMNTNFPHPINVTPPRDIQQPKLIPVVLKLKDTYTLWQSYLTNFPKQNRYTLGNKIDNVFLLAIEYCFLASYASKDTKLVHLERCISRVDLLKLLLQLAWEIRALDTKKYTVLSEQLQEVGRMLGGWRKGLEKKNSPPEWGENIWVAENARLSAFQRLSSRRLALQFHSRSSEFQLTLTANSLELWQYPSIPPSHESEIPIRRIEFYLRPRSLPDIVTNY